MCAYVVAVWCGGLKFQKAITQDWYVYVCVLDRASMSNTYKTGTCMCACWTVPPCPTHTSGQNPKAITEDWYVNVCVFERASMSNTYKWHGIILHVKLIGTVGTLACLFRKRRSRRRQTSIFSVTRIKSNNCVLPFGDGGVPSVGGLWLATGGAKVKCEAMKSVTDVLLYSPISLHWNSRLPVSWLPAKGRKGYSVNKCATEHDPSQGVSRWPRARAGTMSHSTP